MRGRCRSHLVECTAHAGDQFVVGRFVIRVLVVHSVDLLPECGDAAMQQDADGGWGAGERVGDLLVGPVGPVAQGDGGPLLVGQHVPTRRACRWWAGCRRWVRRRWRAAHGGVTGRWSGATTRPGSPPFAAGTRRARRWWTACGRRRRARPAPVPPPPRGGRRARPPSGPRRRGAPGRRCRSRWSWCVPPAPS